MPLHIDALHRILANRSETALLANVLQHWVVIANDNVLYRNLSNIAHHVREARLWTAFTFVFGLATT